MSGQYAKNTNVTSELSRLEIERILIKYGADNFAYATANGQALIGFTMLDRQIKFILPLPKREEFRLTPTGRERSANSQCATDGTHNACSILYGAAWRAAKAMGYKKVVTYILETESGTSLKASGYKCVGRCGGLRWTGKRKPEVDLYPAQMKLRFERETE